MRGLAYSFLLLPAVFTGCGIDAEAVEEDIEHQIRWRQQPGEIDGCSATARMKLIDRLEVIRRQAVNVLSGCRERSQDHRAEVRASVVSGDLVGIGHLCLHSLGGARIRRAETLRHGDFVHPTCYGSPVL